MIKSSSFNYYWFFTLGVILILVVAPLIQDGIFMDGMLYISVGKNLSEGIGTFWNQSFSKTCMFEYHEQPPLYGGLIAIYFKLFGQSMYTERIFCFSFFAFTLFVIYKFWKQLDITSEQKKHAFVPLLFFSITPVVFWAFQNHVEETVMTVFDLTAIYFIHKACFKNEKTYLNLFVSALFIVLATLTKGIQGLFPIGSIALIWITKPNLKSLKSHFLSTLYLASMFVLIYSILLFIFPDAYISFKKYFSIRLVNTFNHVGATTENRFYLLFKLLNELIPVATLTFIIYLIGRNKINNSSFGNVKKQEFYWLLLIGLSGSLPLMITLEQRGFYLVTAFPYFILAFSLLASHYLSFIIFHSEKSKKALRIFTLIVLISGISFCFISFSKTKRDEELLHDVYLTKSIFKQGELVGIPENMWNDWNLQTYMIRYNYVSLSMAKNNRYYIIRKDLEQTIVPVNYEKLNLPTQFFDIYELKKVVN